MKKTIIAIFGALLFSSTAFAAPSVIFNGIDITGATNQHFTDVTVDFDANGNVILTAPQYKLVDTTPQAAVPPSSAIPAKIITTPTTAPIAPKPEPSIDTLPDRINPTYIVASFDSPGLLGHNIDVYVNGQFVKTINQGEAHQVVDVSQYLKSGKNTIHYRLIMAADSGTSSRATVDLALSKVTAQQGNAVELTGQYASIKIKGIDGAKMYSVDVMAP